MAFGVRAFAAPAGVAARLALFIGLVSAALPAAARPVTILAPELPPMMAADGTGREASIIKETLAACGHEAHFKVVPFGRHWNDYRAGVQAGRQMDAVPSDVRGARAHRRRAARPHGQGGDRTDQAPLQQQQERDVVDRALGRARQSAGRPHRAFVVATR